MLYKFKTSRPKVLLKLAFLTHFKSSVFAKLQGLSCMMLKNENFSVNFQEWYMSYSRNAAPLSIQIGYLTKASILKDINDFHALNYGEMQYIPQNRG